MTKAAAFYNFWSRFLPAYEENTVPTGDDSPGFPYITYDLVYGAFSDAPQAMTASVWYNSTSLVKLNSKIKEISEYIGLGGIVLNCDDGKIWITRGSPFAQIRGDTSDDNIKRGYINIWADYITEN